jgi:hypothetical protein
MTIHHHSDDFTVTPARTRMSGILAGSWILTARGEIKIEDLRVGDRIVTRDKGMASLRAISRRHAGSMMAVCLPKDSLGKGRPARDVRVTPGQHIYLRDWRAEALFGATTALVPAYRIVDGTIIREARTDDTVMFDLHFDTDVILYAAGLEVGSGCPVEVLIARSA